MADVELYPLFLKLAGRRVLVVGAGTVAERKIESLLRAGARVQVVAPKATQAIEALGRAAAIARDTRGFEARDTEGVWLAIAATSDPEVQAAVASACAARRVFCIAVDDPPNASAYSGAVVRREPFTIAISSSGEAPALTRLVREVIEHALPSEQWVAHARRLRKKWRQEKTPMGQRFAELVKELATKG